MQALRIASISLVVVIVAVVLAFWWAGFAPFPTAPVLLASYQTDGFCMVPADSENWALCEPRMSQPTPQGSLSDYRMFPNGNKDGYGQYNQWGVEGFTGCWDGGCENIFHAQDTNTLTHKIYYDHEVPHFGLGTPKWIVVLQGHTSYVDGDFAETAYTTYAACMYRKPPDTNADFYKCKKIDTKDPWKVGTITFAVPK
jgi:hypothetical protein